MWSDIPYTPMRPAVLPQGQAPAPDAATTRPATTSKREATVDRFRSRSPRTAKLAATALGYNVDQASTVVSNPEEVFDTENVAEALRVKQRMRARQGLRSILTNPGVPPHLGHLEFAPSSSSSSSSSPASTPPSTPLILPTEFTFPTRSRREGSFSVAARSRGRSESASSSGMEDWTIRSPSKSKHRPSRSRSSVISRSLSRHSSRSSTSSPSPISTLSTSAILDFVGRLAPLPRFNPYRRPRAESLSAVRDGIVRTSSGTSAPRRRCKSQPEAATGRHRRQ
ncbi:hypothetical protein GY45DRAFT_1326242 [Cubamyces sp. BRFM 1775]|nr:hypothetical protein GY45DRAFT_1326242 [Cubamyces sp. BRFM 1775]